MSNTNHATMTDGLEGAGQPEISAASVISATGDADHVMSRRRVLLKGIGKGSAILAAAAPIKTLASTPSVTANGQICTISGVQSGAHSPATNLPTCAGKKARFYSTIANWPNGDTTYPIDAAHSFSKVTKFNALFGGGSTSNLMNILKDSSVPPEAHWIAALLNGIKAPAGYVFPYSAQEVLALYAGPQQAAALVFFQGFMETL